jgi:CelD/BcsL family acetyltransferase involved in cellulose biosynthesis
MNFRLEIVTDPARFAALQGPWQQLWAASNGRIFQSHDWLSGWLAGVRDRKEIRPQIALAWEGDLLAAAMPCAVHRRSGLRILHWAAQLFSDYCDCLVDPAQDRSVLLALLWDGMRQFGGFDLISLQQVRPDAGCRGFFEALVNDAGQLRIDAREERCMRIENQWPNGTAFFRSLNKKARNNHTRGKRILSELGGEVSFRVIEPGQPVQDTVAEILRLKEVWLHTHDPDSTLFGSDGTVLRAVIDRAWKSGLAYIFLLECGGKIAAASINFVYDGRMEAYLTSYDEAFERASPGTILIVEYAQWSFDRRLTLVDFLRGDEAFKFRMANAETLLSTFTGARTLVGHVAISGHRWLAKRRKRQDAVETKTEAEPEAVG